MSGAMVRWRRRKGGMKTNRRNRQKPPWRAGSGLWGQPSLLTDADLEGHHLAQRTLPPSGPQVAAVMKTPWKGQRSVSRPHSTPQQL